MVQIMPESPVRRVIFPSARALRIKNDIIIGVQGARRPGIVHNDGALQKVVSRWYGRVNGELVTAVAEDSNHMRIDARRYPGAQQDLTRYLVDSIGCDRKPEPDPRTQDAVKECRLFGRR